MMLNDDNTQHRTTQSTTLLLQTTFSE